MGKIIFVILFVGSAVMYGYAQDPSFTATVSKNPVGIGEQFELSFSLNASGNRFQPPSLDNFHVLGGPSQSTSMQITNGSFSQTITFSYVLQPKAEGSFTIAPAYIEAGRKRLASDPITLNVVKGNSRPQSASPQTKDEDDIAGQIAGSVFLKVSVNKTNACQGEAIIATYKLYTKISLVNFNFEKIPSYNGFWSQDVELPQQPEFRNEIIDGQNFKAAEIKKVILFPQKSGTFSLAPMEGECTVRIQLKRKQQRQGGSIWDQFFNDPFFGDPFSSSLKDINQKVKSNVVKITVKPFPDGAPASFHGVAGSYAMEALLDKTETKANEPAALKIKISGTGNLKLLATPVLNIPPDIESYDPKITDNISVSASGISGSRTFDFLLIPRHAGEYKIEPYLFSFFDTGSKRYITLPTPAFTLKVAKGADTGQGQVVAGLGKEDVKLIGKDIRFIKQRISLTPKKTSFAGSLAFYVLASMPFVLAFFLFLFAEKQRTFQRDLLLVRNRKANKIARKRLASARKFMKLNAREKFFEEISKALWGYVADKLGIEPALLSKENIAEKLSERAVPHEAIQNLSGVIDQSDFARFAPAGSAPGMDTLYKKAEDIILYIEQNLK